MTIQSPTTRLVVQQLGHAYKKEISKVPRCHDAFITQKI